MEDTCRRESSVSDYEAITVSSKGMILNRLLLGECLGLAVAHYEVHIKSFQIPLGRMFFVYAFFALLLLLQFNRKQKTQRHPMQS